MITEPPPPRLSPEEDQASVDLLKMIVEMAGVAKLARARRHVLAEALIMEALRKHVIALYEAALANLKEHGENYYWERKQHNDQADRQPPGE